MGSEVALSPSACVGLDEAKTIMSLQSVRALLRRVVGRAVDQQRTELTKKVLELSGGTPALHFGNFLRLMRWVLDTDFAAVGQAASSVAKGEKTSRSTGALSRSDCSPSIALKSQPDADDGYLWTAGFQMPLPPVPGKISLNRNDQDAQKAPGQLGALEKAARKVGRRAS